MEYCALLVTVPNSKLGKKISRALVEERLAACVNQVPGLGSTYWWRGKVVRDAEELLIIKTRKSLAKRVADRVKTLHTYQIPEVIALPVIGGHAPYLEWIRKETKANGRRD